MKFIKFILIFLFLINKFLFRKYLIGIYFTLDIIIGSFPNFVASFLIPVVIVETKDKNKNKSTDIVIITSLLLIFEEFYPIISGNVVYDVNDILFTILGGAIALLHLRYTYTNSNRKF